jgi:large exoprotein involved in heme utilization and adhesion
MTGGSQINTVTLTSGSGGNVTINSNSISISGEFSSAPDPIGGIGTIHPGGIFTQTLGSEFCAGSCGGAGRVSITTGSLAMGSGAQINTGTSGTQPGGDISIHAMNNISLSGTLSDGSPGGIFSKSVGTSPDAGSGGNIALVAGQSVTLTNGSSISASSSGAGNAGNIMINAGQNYTSTDSAVTTVADQASGGNITVLATDTVQLTNSKISASVLDGTGGGGSVNIDPQFVILLNSQILAQAVQGPGGNISITTNFLLPDANSTISASSQFGTNGTVTIQSPNAPISGQIQPLGKSPLLATTLLNQHCAALAGGEFSSFTVAGRDSLPTEPGSWLASPLALGPAGFSAGAVAEASAQARVIDDPAQETTVLSLRQIAPAGFLTQAFAVDWSASCQS